MNAKHDRKRTFNSILHGNFIVKNRLLTYLF